MVATAGKRSRKPVERLADGESGLLPAAPAADARAHCEDAAPPAAGVALLEHPITPLALLLHASCPRRLALAAAPRPEIKKRAKKPKAKAEKPTKKGKQGKEKKEKKAPGPYMIFCKEMRPKIAKESMSFGEVGKALGIGAGQKTASAEARTACGPVRACRLGARASAPALGPRSDPLHTCSWHISLLPCTPVVLMFAFGVC